jgi:hypothetical protein
MKNLILVTLAFFLFSCKNLKELGKIKLEEVSEIVNSWNANPPAFMVKNTNGWRELGPNLTDNTTAWSATNATLSA